MIFPEELARMIDHTNVKPDATLKDIEKLCMEAIDYGFSSACVTPSNTALASRFLKQSDVGVCVVVGFPFGTPKSETKTFETIMAIEEGARDIDMVMNIGAMKSGLTDLVANDIASVVDAAEDTPVKVIIETALLTDAEKVAACEISKESGAKFVKTSTGVGYPGANAHDVELMRRTVGKEMGVKASGGIRDLETAVEMIDAGASKIGTSTGVGIMEEILKEG